MKKVLIILFILKITITESYSQSFNYNEFLSNLRNGSAIGNFDEQMNYFFKQDPDEFGFMIHRICCYESSDFAHQNKMIQFLLSNYPRKFDELRMKAMLFHDFISDEKIGRGLLPIIEEQFKNDKDFFSFAQTLMDKNKTFRTISESELKTIQEHFKKPIFEGILKRGLENNRATFLVIKNLKLFSPELDEVLLKRYEGRFTFGNDKANIFRFLVYENENSVNNLNLIRTLIANDDYKKANFFNHGDDYQGKLLNFFIKSFKNFPNLINESSSILRFVFNDVLKSMPLKLSLEAEELLKLLIKNPKDHLELLEDLLKNTQIKSWFKVNAQSVLNEYFDENLRRKSNKSHSQNDSSSSSSSGFSDSNKPKGNNCESMFKTESLLDLKGYLTFADWKDLNKHGTELKWALEQLKLPPNATVTEIKQVFRNLSNMYHPDKNKSLSVEESTKISAIINSAKTVLLKKK